MATNNYAINYDDQEYKDIENQKQSALNENNALYDGMINDSDAYYQSQIDATKEWEQKQTDIQNEQTAFAIEKIKQQQEQAKKDYTREQSGAYTDWQKQSDKHGVRAEQIADMGMQNTGYSESAQVSMYNTYQNRVAVARESFNLAVQNFTNAITDARLQNNAALAEIAYQSFQKQAELALQAFQYKNQLLLAKADKKAEIDDRYYGRRQDVTNQKNTENSLAEQIRQFNESMALEREQFEWQKEQTKKKSSGGGGGSRSSSGGGGGGGGGGDDDQINKPQNTSTRVGDDTNPSNTDSKTAYAKSQLDKAIAGGASKDKVSNAISNALKNGVITQKQANDLRATYTPRGLQY